MICRFWWPEEEEYCYNSDGTINEVLIDGYRWPLDAWVYLNDGFYSKGIRSYTGVGYNMKLEKHGKVWEISGAQAHPKIWLTTKELDSLVSLRDKIKKVDERNKWESIKQKKMREDPLWINYGNENDAWIKANGLTQRYDGKNEIYREGVNLHTEQCGFSIKLYGNDPDLSFVRDKIVFLLPYIKPLPHGRKKFSIFEHSLSQHAAYSLESDGDKWFVVRSRYHHPTDIYSGDLDGALEYIRENHYYEKEARQ